MNRCSKCNQITGKKIHLCPSYGDWGWWLKGKHNSARTEFEKNNIPWNRQNHINICIICKKDFRISKSRLWRLTCSSECRALNSKKLTKKCVVCKKDFQVSFYRKNTAGCCSYGCLGIYHHQRGTTAGINNSNWKGGITSKNHLVRNSFEYIHWRKAVFERDSFTCQFCRIRGGQLQADHIKPFAYFPELRFELSNGRTLCKSCHRKTDTYGDRAKKLYQVKTTII